jgi:hypothetical protein
MTAVMGTVAVDGAKNGKVFAKVLEVKWNGVYPKR